MLQPRLLSEEECELFTNFGNNKSTPQIVNSFVHFLENFISLYEYDIWGHYVNWDLFVIGGGSVICSLLMQPIPINGSDVDLFFLKQGVYLFREAAVRF